jgi:hypothetical protein
MSRRTLRTFAAPLALALTLVACGQKPGVHVEGRSLAGGGGGELLTEEEIAAGEEREPQGSDRTGVTDDTITIASTRRSPARRPCRPTSFEEARDLYWRWVIRGEGQEVLGREKSRSSSPTTATSRPTRARSAASSMSRAFSLAGGGGPTRSRPAASRGPGPGALLLGRCDRGRARGNPWYFAADACPTSSREPLLAQYVKKNQLGQEGRRHRHPDTATSTTRCPGWESAAQERHRLPRHPAPPEGRHSWYGTFAKSWPDRRRRGLHADLPARLHPLRADRADQGHDFEYVGVGVTKGLNAVLNSGCSSDPKKGIGNGTFLSPFPALETVGKLDPEFQQAARKFGVQVDDIAWAIWGTSKLQHELFKKYEAVFGTDLTREDYREIVANAGKVSTGVFPDVNFTPNNNFGSQGVHVLKADCGSKTYKDGGTFKSGF